jgi:transcriptional regulator with XRE-family HTH domain
MPKKKIQQLPPLELNNEPIGTRLAKLRKTLGLTQKELAQKIGITQTLISDYEVGRAHLVDEMIIRFSIALNVSTDEILGVKKKNRNIPNLKLMKRMYEIEKLPPSRQRALLQNIDMFLQGSRQKKAS